MRNNKLAIKGISLEQAAKMKLDALKFNLSMRLSDFAMLNGLPDQGVASMLHSRLHEKAKASLMKTLTSDNITIKGVRAVLKGNAVLIKTSLEKSESPVNCAEHEYAIKHAQQKLEENHGKRMSVFSDQLAAFAVKTPTRKSGNSKGQKMPAKKVAPAPVAPAPVVS